MTYARIIENTIVELLQQVPGFTAEQCYHRDLLAACAQVSGDAQVGWVRQEDGTFADPAVTLPAEVPVEEPVADAAPEAPTDGV